MNKNSTFCLVLFITIAVFTTSIAEARFRRKSYTLGLRFGDPTANRRYGNDDPVEAVQPLIILDEPSLSSDTEDLFKAAEALAHGGENGDKRSSFNLPYLSHLAVIETACSGHGQPCTRGRPSGILGTRSCCPGLICASKSFSMLSGHAVCQPDSRISY